MIPICMVYELSYKRQCNKALMYSSIINKIIRFDEYEYNLFIRKIKKNKERRVNKD